MPKKSRLRQLQKELMKDPVIRRIDAYLETTKHTYSLDNPEFGGRLALKQAKEAYLSGNYGIGAALFVFKPHETQIFLGKNKIVTGTPSERFNTHGETDAIKSWLGYLEGKNAPYKVVRKNNSGLGIKLYTNLEPCPKCEMEITLLLTLAKEFIHPASTVRCICLSVDGKLRKSKDLTYPTGSAHALGKKHFVSPLVWRSIQRGYFPGQKPLNVDPVQFSLLSTSNDTLQGHIPTGMFIKTADQELVTLGWEIFAKTRSKIDQFLISDQI